MLDNNNNPVVADFCFAHAQRDEAFTTSNGGRPGVPHIGIVVWDGVARADGDDVLRLGVRVRLDGVRLLVFGVGTNVDPVGMASVASWPANDTVLVVRSAANLTTIEDRLVEATCDGKTARGSSWSCTAE